jgi:hypothetical protein
MISATSQSAKLQITDPQLETIEKLSWQEKWGKQA